MDDQSPKRKLPSFLESPRRTVGPILPAPVSSAARRHNHSIDNGNSRHDDEPVTLPPLLNLSSASMASGPSTTTASVASRDNDRLSISRVGTEENENERIRSEPVAHDTGKSETVTAPVVDRSKPQPKVTAKSPAKKSKESEPVTKKRRKVNHACIYCRRSHMTCDLERPCTRCVKRNIGHLCHDEIRQPDKKKSGATTTASSKVPASKPAESVEASLSGGPPAFSTSQAEPSSAAQSLVAAPFQAPSEIAAGDKARAGINALLAQSGQQSVLGRAQALPTSLPTQAAANPGLNTAFPVDGNDMFGLPGTGIGLNTNGISTSFPFSELWMGHSHLSDMPNYPNNYMAAASEVSSEVKLLNDFLHTSMLDDGMALGAPNQQLDGSLFGNGMTDPFSSLNGNGPIPSAQGGPPVALNTMSMLQNMAPQHQNSMMPPPGLPNGHLHGAQQPARPPVSAPSRHHHFNSSSQGSSSQNQITLPSIKVLQRDRDKAARDYYLQAADPVGADTPEERMQRLLKAKYEAGLLKPFNYIRGYQKLSAYLDSHIAPASKQKIVKCLDRFRPKFREIAQALTDVELVVVEMWFEKQLMEYDRVFASMAVPACLWRRTGEIYRGNKEMAELLRVPVEKLRDGSIALHQIMTEDSMVRYWEEFETIAFDPDHDTLLTACTLKDPAVARPAPGARMVNCAFSFMIHRDDYKMPTLIIGNFLPHDPGN